MASAFAEILAELVGQVPGAIGAVFLDYEGEAVDQFSHIPLMDILLAGAHWGIILRHVENTVKRYAWGRTELLVLNGTQTDIIIKPITDEYAIVLAMKAGHHLAHALTAVERVTVDIEREM